MKNKVAIVIIVLLALICAAVFWLFQTTDIVETVKKETAKLLVYEYIPNQKIDIETREAFLKKDSIYTDFRKKYRFHFQTVGLAQFPDSSRMTLISEPPPHFEIDSIQSIFVKFTHAVEVRKHKIGYDGRISDVMILLGNATDENVKNLLPKLYKELFFSDYKPKPLSLPADNERVYFTKSNIDYRISLHEFNEWFIENEEPFFMPDDTTNTETIQSIFKEQRRGVYFSCLPGFVAWAISKKSDLAEQLEHIRQFTLDADLILGALSDSATLVVIGREREASPDELPPLNVESILLLASITEKELSQSLDVNDLMAGKMRDGKDWCPTYLSKELENTEFGHLLTITDILLKDWSERGTIQEAYYRYPKPGYYPFDKPLFKKLGLSELVYNWNTANVMFAIDLDDVTIYTLNRTGSLPVSYFNSQERSVSIGRKYENQAYHYFATTGNTDLARVVQYTALYQLFIDNEITYSGDVHTAFPAHKPTLLKKPASNLMEIYKNLTPEDIRYLSDTSSKIKFEAYQKKRVLEQMHENEQKYNFTYTDEQQERIFKDVINNAKRDISGEFYQVRGMLLALSDEKFQQLAKYVACPRCTRVRNAEDYNIMLKGRQINKLTWNFGKNYLYLLGVELGDVKNYYVNNLASSSGRYVKTPSVIITYNDFLTTGGHNLSSKISRVKSMTNYKPANYVPEDATPPKPATTPPQPTAAAPKSPAGTATPTATASKPTTTPKPATTTAATKPATRPRSEVISTAPRQQRGF
ncbi:MAG: hypothetical protein FWF09_04455 [Bacteroidales bacterium]|nr:hypothetical protein [Bacteroidales bacterium]